MPTPEGGARIRARDWTYRYPRRAEPALRSVGFDIGPGELVVLMGASGSGKSTLLGALAGTLPADGAAGELTISGSPGVGLVQQDPQANIVMELVGDDVAFPLENAAVAPGEIWPRVREALRRTGLEVAVHRPTVRLSGGQQQLLGLAAAAVADPELLLLDEPTANLDAASAARVFAAVAALRRSLGSTVVVVEHRVEPWLARADRMLLVHEGSVVSLSPAQVVGYLRERPALASRVWVDHTQRPHLAPRGAPGGETIRVEGLRVEGRLAAASLVARAGEVVALTGPSGSGKSTLLSCLAGLSRPDAGTVRVGGDGDPWRWPARTVAGTFGVVFQNPEHQFVTSRVIDELLHGLEVAGVPREEALQRAEAMLGRLRLTELAHADPFTLSGGEQRRLGVGTALVLDPRVLVLDEPTFGQDPATWRELAGIIAAHRDAGGTVIMATHDEALVSALGARVVELEPWAAAEPDAADAPALRGLRRLDPLALLLAASLLSVAALLSASVRLNLALALFTVGSALVGGLPARRVGLLVLPALIAAVSVGFSNILLGGGFASAAWSAAALPATRVLALALPGLAAAFAMDPTALADRLVRTLGVSPRAAYGVLAGFRLLPLLRQEWEVLGRASRARGLGGSGVSGRLRQFGSMTLRLLVAALRRGQRLAVALDARGLRAGDRTIARPLRWTAADTLAVVVGAGWLAAAALTR